jgi:hypothetical protein
MLILSKSSPEIRSRQKHMVAFIFAAAKSHKIARLEGFCHAPGLGDGIASGLRDVALAVIVARGIAAAILGPNAFMQN